MNRYQEAFQAVVKEPRYLENLSWGSPRPGHPEGTIALHVEHLEANLALLRDTLDPDSYWKLRLLIHVHDTFKGQAQEGVAISHPRSHASLAREFLEPLCPDPDLLAMVWRHDEPYALWLQFRQRGSCRQERLLDLLESIQDWRLFVLFLVIDGTSPGKDTTPLRWVADEIASLKGLKDFMLEVLAVLTRDDVFKRREG